MTTTTNEAMKDLMRNAGTFLILAGSAAMKADAMIFLLLGLALLVLQLFDLKGVPAGKRMMAEIMLSGAVAVAAIAHLVQAKNFHATQFFMIFVLLGAILVIVEAIRQFAER